MNQPNETKTDQIAGRLLTFLRAELDDATIAYDTSLTQLTGGYETATYQFRLKGVQKELNKRLVLRIFPKNRPPESAAWESSVQNALADAGYPVARAYVVNADKSVLGGAFFVMDFLPGGPPPLETIPDVLGKTHAALHKIDPGPLIKLLNEQGFDEHRYKFRTDIEDALAAPPNELPWMRDIAEWLTDHRPPEPERLAICHGDFHPGNILYQDGNVGGVLDWHLFIADPALDIANTIKLLTVHYGHFWESPPFLSFDWEMVVQLYLDAYRTELPLDSTNLEYFRVLQAFVDLYDGTIWTPHLSHPLVVRDLIEFIHDVTGIRITMPD